MMFIIKTKNYTNIEKNYIKSKLKLNYNKISYTYIYSPGTYNSNIQIRR